MTMTRGLTNTAAGTARGIQVGEKILIVGRNHTYLAGLRMILDEAGFDVDLEADIPAATASDYATVIVIVREDELVQSVETLDGTPCLAVLIDARQEAYRRAFLAGAVSAADWEARPDHLVRVLSAALDGNVLLPTRIVRALCNTYNKKPEWLSAAELKWLRLLAHGETTATIARHASYSERHMHQLLHNLYRRMGVRNRSEAIAVAARWAPTDDDCENRTLVSRN